MTVIRGFNYLVCNADCYVCIVFQSFRLFTCLLAICVCNVLFLCVRKLYGVVRDAHCIGFAVFLFFTIYL